MVIDIKYAKKMVGIPSLLCQDIALSESGWYSLEEVSHSEYRYQCYLQHQGTEFSWQPANRPW